MPYGDIDLGQHWLRYWHVAWCHAITWTNADLSSRVFSGIHLRTILQTKLMNLICNMCFELTLLRLLPLLPDTNELNLHSAYATTGLIKFKFCDFMEPALHSSNQHYLHFFSWISVSLLYWTLLIESYSWGLHSLWMSHSTITGHKSLYTLKSNK